MRVTADTNIYISGLLFGGQPKRLLDLARKGEFELCISPAILDEVSRVLRDKFRVPAVDIDETRALISSFTTSIEPARAVDAVLTDPTDNRVLECAVASGSSVVISGDKHLLSVIRYENIEVLKVSEFIARLESTLGGT